MNTEETAVRTRPTPSTPREAAVAEVDDHLRTVARLEAEQAAAVAELASLQERAGEEVLADESAAGRIARQMRDLKDRVDIIGRAITAASSKLHAARVRVVTIDAEWWEAETARRRTVLAAHEARTAELLAQLEAHEGRFVFDDPSADAARNIGVVNATLGVVLGAAPRKSRPLCLSVRRGELRALVCRAMVAGDDPATILDTERSLIDGTVAGVLPHELYPASVWGPDAVMAAPAYQRQASAQRVAAPAAAGA